MNTTSSNQVCYLDLFIAAAASLGILLSPFFDWAAITATITIAIASYAKVLSPLASSSTPQEQEGNQGQQSTIPTSRPFSPPPPPKQTPPSSK